MNVLNFSENIIKLRHKKGITQEELAQFIGVTKASVSKWETKQSMPDILLLPQLAAYFDVTVDELLGYEPQLSKEQIRMQYSKLTEAFARESFEEVYARSKSLVHQYYSCYTFLQEMAVLWLNHFMLAQGEARQKEVLKEAASLCSHIIADCRDIAVCNKAVLLKATIDMQCGKAKEVIGTLEEIMNPYNSITQNDTILIQAYLMDGQLAQAEQYTQLGIYTHLINMVADSVQYLALHMGQPDICKKTIERVDKIIEVYQLKKLHPNVCGQYDYQVALMECMNQCKEEAIERLKDFASVSLSLFTKDEAFIHGDDYFDKIDSYFEKLDIGTKLPRDKKVIVEGMIQALDNPVFATIAQDVKFIGIKRKLMEEGAKL